MKVFTCTDHKGHWVGVASVIVADDHKTACALLGEELHRHGLGGQDFTLDELDLAAPRAVVLCDGDY